MSATLLAVVIALVLGHTVRGVSAWRNIDWYLRWNEWLAERRSDRSGWGFVLVIIPPLMLVALLQWWLAWVWLGLFGFVFAVLVLLYSWGPRDLDHDVEAVLDADDPADRRAALAKLRVDASQGAPDSPMLVNAVVYASLRRWFGVLFWFLVLGPVGALAYRLLVVSADGPGQAMLDPRELSVAAKLLQIAEWPVAQMMTLGMALVGDFDRVISAWRDWHATGATLSSGFVLAAARACVYADTDGVVPEVAGGLGETGPDAALVDFDLAPGAAAMRDAMNLVWRLVLLWLAVLALFVLAGFVN